MSNLSFTLEREIKLTNEVEEVFEEEEKEHLRCHGPQRGEWNLIGSHAESFGGRMEEPNLYERRSQHNWRP